jgi:porin
MHYRSIRVFPAACCAAAAIASPTTASAGSVAAPIAQAAGPDDDGVKVTGVTDISDAAELVPAAAAGLPPVLSGQQPGARDPAPQTPPSASDSAREWFGQKPWSAWTRVTGDWAGARTSLEDAGFKFSGSAVTEWSQVFRGGTGSPSAFRFLVDLNLALDLEKLAGLAGGTVFADFQTANSSGGGVTSGAYQTYSNIAIDGSITQLSQLWYEQWFASRALRLKVGKVDANSEFAYIGAAGGFINASAGFSPAIFALPTYPNPATSANLFVYPTENVYIGVGIYDGASAADGIATGSRGPATFFSDDQSDDWFMIGEAGVTFAEAGPLTAVRAAVGAWWHTGQFGTFDGGTADGTGGFYALAEARLWKPEGVKCDNACDRRGLWMFGQLGLANGDVSAVAGQYAVGSSIVGTFDGRDDDSAGVYLSIVDFSNNPAAGFGANECALELYYDFVLTPCVHIKPDLQWFGNPSGGQTDDSLVGTIRCIFTF